MNAITNVNAGEIMESVIVKGDLGKLSPEERSRYYLEVCKSVGLNPLTTPFAYITLNGKLTLYALRGCTDQLRSIHKVSVEDLTETERGDVFIVTAKVKNGEGRTDMAKGAVTIGNLKGDALANMIMKAETKAKRRATLSICGLGVLDETEIETIPGAAPPPANGNGQPKRKQADISADAAFKRTEAKRVQDDVNQITSFVALERYKREVLTPEFMAKFGNGQWGIEEMFRRREEELMRETAPQEDVVDYVPDDVDDLTGGASAEALRDEMVERIEACDSGEQLHRLAELPDFKIAVTKLPEGFANTVRRHWAARLKKLPTSP